MEKYPKFITREVLEQVSGVDNATIRQDITDTEAEISKMEKEVKAYQILAETQRGTPQGKIDAFRCDAYISGIAERREFVRFLKAVLEARSEVQH
jgi:hypothetical protein